MPTLSQQENHTTFSSPLGEAGRGFTFIPSGGLANRMRAIASAVNLSRLTGISVEIVWFRDWGLNARFCDIFQPISTPGITLRDATWLDKLTLDRPRRHNLYIPRLYQALRFRRRIDEQQVTPLKQQGFDFCQWALQEDKKEKRKEKNNIPEDDNTPPQQENHIKHSSPWGRLGGVYMSCYQVFGEFHDYDALIRELFQPKADILSKVDAYVRQFSDYTIGLHIRRTDNQESINGSPLQSFIDIVNDELRQHPTLTVYLATDDEPTKQEMRHLFGQRVITPDAPATRGSLDGIRDGLVDMWTLSRTNVIYGSKGSSFSDMSRSLRPLPASPKGRS